MTTGRGVPAGKMKKNSDVLKSWHGQVLARARDGITDLTVTFEGRTLPDALAAGFRAALSLASLGAFGLRIAGLHCRCLHCAGSGAVAKDVKGVRERTKCQRCKGTGHFDSHMDIPIEVPAGIKIVRA